MSLLNIIVLGEKAVNKKASSTDSAPIIIFEIKNHFDCFIIVVDTCFK